MIYPIEIIFDVVCEPNGLRSDYQESAAWSYK